jgi:hypothetical protein
MVFGDGYRPVLDPGKVVILSWYNDQQDPRLRRPAEVRYKPAEGVTLRLRRLLDALQFSPALINTAASDVVACDRAAAMALTNWRPGNWPWIGIQP